MSTRIRALNLATVLAGLLATTPALVLAQQKGATQVRSAADKEKEKAEGRAQIKGAVKAAVDEVLAQSPLRTGRVTLEVRSLDDGSVIYAHNADDLLNPASNVKLVTSAAALVLLGPDHRFETEFLVSPEATQEKARVLYVRGKGDPSITTEKLYGIVSELVHTGIREIGDVVVDDSWFDAEREAPGYDQESSDRAYMSPTGAVSLNWNTIGIYVRPGRTLNDKPAVELEPHSDFFIVDSTLTTGKRRYRRFSVSSEAAGDRQKIILRGVLPADPSGFALWKKIDNPPMYFGQTLRSMLAMRGVKVRGKVKLGVTPADARLRHVSQSDSLDIVLKRLNKNSSNFIAEQLIKTLGAELKGRPGTHAAGLEVVEEFLEREVGLPRGTYVMKNGSGLNDTNRFSAAQVNKLLVYMWRRFPLAPEYLSSLGIAGKDGTLRYRFEGSDAVGRLRAKTGTLDMGKVSALSGYVQAVGGERFVFAVMVNDYSGRSGPVVQGIDAVGAAVAAVGSASGPDRAVLAVMKQERQLTPMQEALTRVKTYLALGKQADQRNITFLRTAWRSERDPAVRAVVAESIYRSNPQDYLGVRTLLDSVEGSSEVYGRLREVARALSIDVPGVTAVVEVAAEGNVEALARLVEFSKLAAGDDAAERETAAALAEVARTAPEELLLAMKNGAPAEREAATRLLSSGLVQAGDANHPFWPALRRSMGAPDPSAAAFARQVDATLSTLIAQARAPAALPAPSGAVAAEPVQPPHTAESRPGG